MAFHLVTVKISQYSNLLIHLISKQATDVDVSLPCWTDKQDSVQPLTLFDYFPSLSWTVEPG